MSPLIIIQRKVKLIGVSHCVGAAVQEDDWDLALAFYKVGRSLQSMGSYSGLPVFCLCLCLLRDCVFSLHVYILTSPYDHSYDTNPLRTPHPLLTMNQSLPPPVVVVGGFLTRNSTSYWGDIQQHFPDRQIIIAPYVESIEPSLDPSGLTSLSV